MDKELKIVLIGLPGSGKSTLGRHLATKLDSSFLDLDNLIEAKHAMNITDIFAIHGEQVFRQWETELLKETLTKEQTFILASGGGCPCFYENMKLINDSAISVYLDVPLDDITSRLYSSKIQNRPMFKGMNKEEIFSKLKDLKETRSFFYNQAKIKLSGGDFSAELLNSELTRQIRNLS